MHRRVLETPSDVERHDCFHGLTRKQVIQKLTVIV